MFGIFIAILFLCIVAIFWWIDYSRGKKEISTEEEPCEATTECCGVHPVCEKGLEPKSKIEYYDDEELDTFAGRLGESYNEDEIRQFCDVFYTLKEHDVAGWIKSLQARNIELPESLREEVFLIVRERRDVARNVSTDPHK